MWLTEKFWTIVARIRQLRLQAMANEFAPGASIRVFYDKANYFNAVATNDEAGNRIVIVFKKLYKALNEDELNFILAHEISHHLHNHIIVQTITQGLTEGVLEGLRPKGFLEQLGIPIATKEPPWWWKGLNVITRIGLSKLSRDEEFDADQNAVRLLKAAGKPLNGAISALEKMMAQEGSDDLLLQINQMLFGSHPITSVRLDRVASQIAGIEPASVRTPPKSEEVSTNGQKGALEMRKTFKCLNCGTDYDPTDVTSCPKCNTPNWRNSPNNREINLPRTPVKPTTGTSDKEEKG